MPTLLTQGAASARAYGFGASSAAVNYIEDVFSTYLYTGTGGSQTITNGIDLSTKGGMVWIKSRSDGTNNFLFDTARGSQKEINSNTTDAEVALPYSLGPFNTNGFTIGNATGIGVAAATYASWTFRKQPKFFDIVTYTGNGTTQNISHNLGSAPGCIFVKATSSGTNWCVYHRSVGNTGGLILNTTNTTITDSGFWNNTSPTSTQFTVGSGSAINVNSVTYVAYLFAHDAGGFGATGTDNVISCGSFTTNGSGDATLNLGWETQWVLLKNVTSAEDWRVFDNMRGIRPQNAFDSPYLAPNLSNAEAFQNLTTASPSSTSLAWNAGNNQTYIYIAIRRGPMKTPTTGTSVFEPYQTSTGRLIGDIYDSNLNPPDLYINQRQTSGLGAWWQDRLRGWKSFSSRNSSAEEATTYIKHANWDNATGYANWYFRRAPGFFDVVCYTGDGVAGRTITHNLGSAPELMIIKARNNSANWAVYHGEPTKYMFLNSTNATTVSSGYWNDTAPTASVFTVGGVSAVNVSAAYTYVAYLFATVAGVSKVGSYTGTGTTNQINCGFTGGARFVLIKRTDSTGDWYVWDSARGIVAGNDSYLLLNSTAAEVTNTDYVDTYSAGFEISSTAPAAINANGGSFIFFAVA